MLLAYYMTPSGPGAGQLGAVDAAAGVVTELDVPLSAEVLAEGALALIERGLDVATLEARGGPTPLAEVRLGAPLPRPRRNIFCVGKNFRDHVLELEPRSSGQTGDPAPQRPVIFTKPPSAVIGDGDAIFAHPTLTSELDYEAELAVIIGRGGRAISAERALGHVWGYTVVNDVTARDMQRDHQQWFLGKALDTFCPMGPWIVTADQFDLQGAEVSSRVNGELRQRASVRQHVFDVPAVIATISAGITLQPGDVISTGAPAGVGMGFDPPRFLRPGDVVEASVSGIGTIRNPVLG